MLRYFLLAQLTMPNQMRSVSGAFKTMLSLFEHPDQPKNATLTQPTA